MYGADAARGGMMRPDVEMSNARLTNASEEESDGGLTRARLDTPSYNGLWARVTRFLGRSDDDRGPGTFFQTSVVLNCVLVLVLMGVVTFRGASVTPSNAKTGETNTHRHTTNTHVETNLGLVAADEPRCSEIGAAVLEDGGVAVDAAVATALCLGVVHPHSSGIGGGAFAVVFDAKNGTSEVIEFREEAPGGASFDMFSNGSGSGSGVGELRGSEFGGGAVAVPSELAGLHLAWTRHGVLPWPRLVAPSMELAKGFIIGPALAEAIESEKKNLALFEQTKSIFLNENGSAKQRGDVLRNPRLAETLRLVSEFGSEVLRTGALAEALALDIQQAGGFVTKEDLAQYAPRVLQPLSFHALGYEILGVPPPSSGGASLGLILEFMAGFLGEADGRPPSQLDRGTQQHRLVEAFKHAFAMRGNLGDLKGDGNFAGDENLNISGALGDMLDPVFVNELRQMTNDAHTLPVEEYGARWNQVTDSGTTHVSVVDRFGNAVALTSTINTPFGSKLVSKSTGIVLNNQMDDFSVPNEPNHYGLTSAPANFIRAGKKPLSSMSPTIVLDTPKDSSRPPKVIAVLGASGGPRIITAVAQVLLNLFVLNMSPLDAIDAPRIHHQLLPNVLWAENQNAIGDGTARRVDQAVVDALREKGHVVEFSATETAAAQLIAVDSTTGTKHAVSDARKGGKPAAQRK